MGAKQIRMPRRPSAARAIFVGSVICFMLVVCLAPHQSVEAKKAKEKKIIKQLVKSLILKNLSTKKNFVPMPVPIPGKWPQSQRVTIDRGPLFGGGSRETKHVKVRVSDNRVAADKASSNIAAVIAKFLNTNRNYIDRMLAAHLRLDTMQKYTRTMVAQLARNILSNQASLTQNNRLPILTRKNYVVPARKTSNKLNVANNAQPNDIVTTMFNLVKLMQQFRELDRNKLLGTNKKSLFNQYRLPPSAMLSMNINNRKSFMNELNYIHKLTTDFNHRHRQTYNALLS